MIEFDVTGANAFNKLKEPGADFDARYTFYYDETNNIKKFHIKKGDFNVAFSSNFVLGGIAYAGQRPDISNIFHGFNLQPTIKEVKLKNIARGDFTECLKSERLALFLGYLVNSQLYLHFSSLNLLYYSLVDIVNSAIANSKAALNLSPEFHRLMKNDLYEVGRLEIAAITGLFFKYAYPNVKGSDIDGFITELTELFAGYEGEYEYHFGLASLKQILKESRKKGSLPFIMGESSYLLIGGLLPFYMRPLYTFIHSSHVFDNEAEIQEALKEYRIICDGKVLNNYSFLDSKSDLFIQASDIIMGLVGKMSAFINTNSEGEIEEHIGNLNAVQLLNLDRYIDLVLKSERLNPGFFHITDSDDDILKWKFILFLRDKTL